MRQEPVALLMSLWGHNGGSPTGQTRLALYIVWGVTRRGYARGQDTGIDWALAGWTRSSISLDGDKRLEVTMPSWLAWVPGGPCPETRTGGEERGSG